MPDAGAPARRPATAPRPRNDLLESVQRALRVLEVVSAAEDGIPAKAVARRAGLKLSTTYHVLHTLVAEGYLVHFEDRRGYGLGYKIPSLYRRLRMKLDVPPTVAAVVAEVHERADAAAYFAAYRDTEIVVVHVVDSPRTPRVDPLDVGFTAAPHATAFGKVMLSTLSPARRRSLLSGGLPRLTPLTLTDRQELEEELATVRTSGVAVEAEEFQRTVSCLAAPVRHATGAVVGAIAVSVPAAEFERRRRHLEEVVRAGAARAGQAATLVAR